MQEGRWCLSLDWDTLCWKNQKLADPAEFRTLSTTGDLSCWRLRVPTTPLSLCKPFKVFPYVFFTPIPLASLAHLFFLFKYVLLNKKHEACGSSMLCTVFVVYYHALACLFFPSPKRQTQRVSNYFYPELKTNTYDLYIWLNKTNLSGARDYPPLRSCWCHLGFT